uniref:Uncharacterized protein n=1 Tax=Knipowitschia caucasica TaxID=637954 RepID=A0AAV2MH31_KNICA
MSGQRDSDPLQLSEQQLRTLEQNFTNVSKHPDGTTLMLIAAEQYYRLPEGTLELAKISKVLMAMEQGRVTEFKGKSLDQIQIEPEDGRWVRGVRWKVGQMVGGSGGSGGRWVRW